MSEARVSDSRVRALPRGRGDCGARARWHGRLVRQGMHMHLYHESRWGQQLSPCGYHEAPGGRPPHGGWCPDGGARGTMARETTPILSPTVSHVDQPAGREGSPVSAGAVGPRGLDPVFHERPAVRRALRSDQWDRFRACLLRGLALVFSPTPTDYRGRDAGRPAPPAQIRTCGATAYGSYRGCMASKRTLGNGCRMRWVGIQRQRRMPNRRQFMRVF